MANARVPGVENPAYVVTKCLNSDAAQKHFDKLRVTTSSGSARSAPSLHRAVKLPQAGSPAMMEEKEQRMIGQKPRKGWEEHTTAPGSACSVISRERSSASHGHGKRSIIFRPAAFDVVLRSVGANGFNGFNGFQRIPQHSNGFQWIPTDSNGVQRSPRDSNGLQWMPMDSNGFQWIPTDSNGFLRIQRIPMDSHGFQWIPIDSKGFNGFNGFRVGTCKTSGWSL